MLPEKNKRPEKEYRECRYKLPTLADLWVDSTAGVKCETPKMQDWKVLFSELTFTFAVCRRPSVCLSSVVCL